MTQANIVIRATDRTDRAFNAINNNVGRVTNNLLSAKGAFAGFIGVAGVARLGNMAKESIEFADALGKTADKLGISTSALQEYQFAGERSGVTTNNVNTSLQRFTRRLGEAAQGEGVLLKVLEQYNIQLHDHQGNLRSAEDVLADYADVIQATDDKQERLRLTVKAFDQEGANMVNVLRDGSAGLEALREQARESGVVMDEELIRKAEIINDKWDTLSTTIGVKFKSAMISVSEVFFDTSGGANKLQQNLDGMAQEMFAIQREMARTSLFDLILGKDNEEKQAALDALAARMAEVSAEINRITGGDQDAGAGAGVSDRLLQKHGLSEEQIEEIITRDQAVFQLMQENRQLQIEEEALLEAEAQERKRMNTLAHYAEEEEWARRKAERLAKIQQDEIKDQLQRGESAFATMLGNVASHNKTFFQIQKLYRISKLAMEAPAAIADAYAWGTSWGGPPAGATMAGIAAAAMATYASQLASSNYGGGGSGTGASAAGTSPVVAPVEPGQTTSFPEEPLTASDLPARTVVVALPEDGTLISTSAMRQFLEDAQKVAADMGPNTKMVFR